MAMPVSLQNERHADFFWADEYSLTAVYNPESDASKQVHVTKSREPPGIGFYQEMANNNEEDHMIYCKQVLPAICGAVRGMFFACCLAASASAGADEWAPTKPMRFIMPFAPGGSTDVLGRMIAPPLGIALGQQIVVDNRGGAGGIIGTEAIARAQPDGYTFGVIGLSGQAANATLAPKLPYDSVKDFEPLTFIGQSPQAFVINPSNPALSIQDLFARAKAASRPINFATGGVGLGSHIAGELLKQQARVDMVHVPYKGGGPAMTDVMAGQIETMFTPLSTALPFAKAGRLRVLAVASRQRSVHMPNVPTFAESGFPNFYMEEAWGVFGPAHMLPAAARRLHTEIVKVLQKPDIVERITAQGVDVTPTTPEQLRTYIVGEIKKYREVIQRAGIKAN